MITGQDDSGNITEMQCDICRAVYDDVDELREFMCFDFVMGEKSQYPGKEVRFDCCQDCFADAFPDIFEEEIVIEEEVVEEVAAEAATEATTAEDTDTWHQE